MEIYSKQDELNKKINEGKAEENETKELFIELIGLIIEEAKRNEQFF